MMIIDFISDIILHDCKEKNIVCSDDCFYLISRFRCSCGKEWVLKFIDIMELTNKEDREILNTPDNRLNFARAMSKKSKENET